MADEPSQIVSVLYDVGHGGDCNVGMASVLPLRMFVGDESLLDRIRRSNVGEGADRDSARFRIPTVSLSITETAMILFLGKMGRGAKEVHEEKREENDGARNQWIPQHPVFRNRARERDASYQGPCRGSLVCGS
jgi:hypothetical protein